MRELMLLFFDGFDGLPGIRKPEWDAGYMPVQTGRSGTGWCLSGNGNTGPILTLPDCNSIYVGVGIYCDAGTRGSTFARLLNLRRGTTDYLTVNLDSTGHLLLRSGAGNGTILATSTAVMTSSAWGALGLEVDVTTASTGRAKVYLNGALAIDYTGPTAPSAGAVNRMLLQCHDVWQVRWDDLYVCNEVDGTATQGRPNNTLLGDLAVKTLIPNGNGAHSEMVGVDGNSVDNYLYADEQRGDHYLGSNVVGAKDTYALPDLPGTSVSVLAVQRQILAWKSDAGVIGLEPIMRDAGGTITADAAVPLSTSAVNTWSPMRTVKPAGGAWTPADINGLQIGQRVTT